MQSMHPMAARPGRSRMPGPAGGLLLAGPCGQGLPSRGPRTGAPDWAVTTAGWVWGNPAVDDAAAYFGDLSGAGRAVSLQDGLELWSYQAGGDLVASPAPGERTVYFATAAGVVQAPSPAARAPLGE